MNTVLNSVQHTGFHGGFGNTGGQEEHTLNF